MEEDQNLNEQLIDDNLKTYHSLYKISKSKFPHDEGISWSNALKDTLITSFPSILALMFLFINDTVNLIFAGRYFSSNEISAIGMGSLYVNATGFIIGIGLIGGVDTLCSQAFGAKQYYVLGMFVNISRLVLFFFSLFIVVPFIFACESVMIRIRQDPLTIPLITEYVKTLFPYCIFSLQYNVNIRYLQSMKIFFPGMLIAMTTSILHPLWLYLVIHLGGFGFLSIGYITSYTSVINYALSVLYVQCYNPYPQTYIPFDKNTTDFRRIYDFLKLALPSAILFAADFLGFQIVILLSSYIDSSSLATNILFYSFISIISTIPLGMSFSTCSLIGNAIGGGKVITAKRYAIASSFAGTFIVLILTLIIYNIKEQVPFLFTNDDKIDSQLTEIFSIYLFFGSLDALQLILSGVVKGLGIQRLASFLVLVILYPVNIPFSLTLAFVVNYGLIGLWMSQLTSVILLCFSYLILIIGVDWENNTIRIIVKINATNQKLKKKADLLMIDKSQ